MSRIPAWQRAQLLELTATPEFRKKIDDLRSLTGASPERRRKMETLILDLRERVEERPDALSEVFGPEPPDHAYAMLDGVRPDNVTKFVLFVHTAARAVRGKHELGLTWEHGVQVLAALWTDYDGSEFELFCQLIKHYWVQSWNPDSDGTFEAWREFAFEPGRIYVDLTDASPEDMPQVWFHINHERRRLGLPIPRPGARGGAKRRRPKVLGRLDWGQLRNRVAKEPRKVNSWEHKYVAQYTDQRGQTPQTRRRALDNFRKQVRMPLKLLAQRGRRPAK